MKTRLFLGLIIGLPLLVLGSMAAVAANVPRNRNEEAESPTLLTSSEFDPVQVASNEILTVTLPGDVKLALVRIPAGTYQMGSTEEPGSPWNTCAWGGNFCDKPVHTVTIAYDFYFGKYEVTQEQWQAVMGNNPSSHNCPQCPVEQVSWDDSHEFTDALNTLGLGVFRLPSEAEWQYAARAGTTTRFFFGDSTCSPQELYGCSSTVPDACPELSAYAWWGYSTPPGFAQPVGQKLPNPWGLYDIYGNVYEWCEDDWLYPFDAYGGAPTDGSPWLYDPPPNNHKVTLGSWRGYCDPARYRSGFRAYHPRDMRHGSTGLRLVREIPLKLHGTPANRAIYLGWEITAPFTGTWTISYDGTPGDQESPVTGIPEATRAYTLTGLTNYEWYTVTLHAMVDSTSWLSDTVRAMPTDRFVYLPLALR